MNLPYYPSFPQQQNLFDSSLKQAPTQPTTQLIFVNGIDGARSYPMGTGSTVILMDNESDSFFIKSTDNVGLITIRKFQFNEIQIEDKKEAGKDNADITALSQKIDTLIDILTKKEDNL